MGQDPQAALGEGRRGQLEGEQMVCGEGQYIPLDPTEAEGVSWALSWNLRFKAPSYFLGSLDLSQVLGIWPCARAGAWAERGGTTGKAEG